MWHTIYRHADDFLEESWRRKCVLEVWWRCWCVCVSTMRSPSKVTLGITWKVLDGTVAFTQSPSSRWTPGMHKCMIIIQRTLNTNSATALTLSMKRVGGKNDTREDCKRDKKEVQWEFKGIVSVMRVRPSNSTYLVCRAGRRVCCWWWRGWERRVLGEADTTGDSVARPGWEHTRWHP